VANNTKSSGSKERRRHDIFNRGGSQTYYEAVSGEHTPYEKREQESRTRKNGEKDGREKKNDLAQYDTERR